MILVSLAVVEGRVCPFVACAFCHQQIETAEGGVAMYRTDAGPTPNVVFAHVEACATQYKKVPGVGWMGLAQFMLLLSHNVPTLDPEHTEEDVASHSNIAEARKNLRKLNNKGLN